MPGGRKASHKQEKTCKEACWLRLQQLRQPKAHVDPRSLRDLRSRIAFCDLLPPTPRSLERTRPLCISKEYKRNSLPMHLTEPCALRSVCVCDLWVGRDMLRTSQVRAGLTASLSSSNLRGYVCHDQSRLSQTRAAVPMEKRTQQDISSCAPHRECACMGRNACLWRYVLSEYADKNPQHTYTHPRRG